MYTVVHAYRPRLVYNRRHIGAYGDHVENIRISVSIRIIHVRRTFIIIIIIVAIGVFGSIWPRQRTQRCQAICVSVLVYGCACVRACIYCIFVAMAALAAQAALAATATATKQESARTRQIRMQRTRQRRRIDGKTTEKNLKI